MRAPAVVCPAPAALGFSPGDNTAVVHAAPMFRYKEWTPDGWFRTSDIAAPLVSDVLLYALVGVNLALLAALVFVLARSLLKLWVEQRRAAPFARFRDE